MAPTGPWPSRITVLYGSQTGNAEDMAKRVGLQAKLLGHEVLVQTMDDFQLRDLPKQALVIFVCSTTGHGQEPENMRNLFTFMRRKDLPKDGLAKLKFAVYGLGDSSYAKFNYVSKILFKRLVECGAQPLQPLVASDEQHQFGCDGIIYPKLHDLWSTVESLRKNSLPGDAQLPSIQDAQSGARIHRSFSYTVTFHDDDRPSLTPGAGDKFSGDFKSRYNLQEAICVKNERVTSLDHFQDTRFLCFKFTRLEVPRYEPGDVCTIYPENSHENTLEFLSLLGLEPKQRISLRKVDPNYMVNYLYDFVPDGLEVQDLVRYYLDIQSVPKRSFFEFLWPFSENSLERDKLREFASTEGQEEVYDYCIRPKRSILETLLDFPNTTKRIKFEALLDMIPPIKPRSFSIASAQSAHPDEIHLIVGVVSYRTSMRKLRKGLCSNYLARMKPIRDNAHDACDSAASTLRFFIGHTPFKMPRDQQVPLVMVGPGLGIAPFRSFVEHRLGGSLAGEQPPVVAAKSHLYFGCRFPNKDFYFKDELEEYATAGLRLRVAFSRGEPKHYVQDLLLEDAELISRLITHEGAFLYVAGNSKLPEELRTLLAGVLMREQGDAQTADGRLRNSSENAGSKIVAQLEACNRIQYDCW